MNERNEVIIPKIPVRSILVSGDVLWLLELAADDASEREGVMSHFLEHGLGEHVPERKEIRSALTFFFWQQLELMDSGRISRASFILLAFPVFDRFCTGMLEVSEEDRWVVGLIDRSMYTPEQDPKAQGLVKSYRELAMLESRAAPSFNS